MRTNIRAYISAKWRLLYPKQAHGTIVYYVLNRISLQLSIENEDGFFQNCYISSSSPLVKELVLFVHCKVNAWSVNTAYLCVALPQSCLPIHISRSPPSIYESDGWFQTHFEAETTPFWKGVCRESPEQKQSHNHKCFQICKQKVHLLLGIRTRFCQRIYGIEQKESFSRLGLSPCCDSPVSKVKTILFLLFYNTIVKDVLKIFKVAP